ncbi:MAG: hypothetical protein WEB87_03415 [Bacteriovoracaceae bacterium]
MPKQLAIIGFGNQAKAWALNLKDSGYEIFIGLRQDSSSLAAAKSLGLRPFIIGEPLPCSDVAMLTPDDTHLEIAAQIAQDVPFKEDIHLIFAHGYSLFFERLAEKHPEFDCLLLAPKAIASELRLQYEVKGKLGAVYSAELSQSKNRATKKLKTLALDLGISSFHPTTIEAETKADLFSEQALLCSSLPYSALFAFNKLIEKGINEETAYFECWYEVKLIADAMVKMGPLKFFDLISPNALEGSEIGKKQLFDQNYFDKLEKLYEDIDNGNFHQHLEDTSVEATREKVAAFWKAQRLSETHEKMRKDLF